MPHITNGGAAFPANPNNAHCEPGMTLRDYFAAKAMQAAIGAARDPFTIGVNHPDTNLNFAKVAYALADAMLAAREVQS